MAKDNKSQKSKSSNGVNNSFKMILVLAIVGLISGASLALVYNYAIPQIEENQKTALEEAIFKVFTQGKDYELLDEEKEIYKVLDKRGALLGYAFTAEGNGYQGKIELMVGLSKDLTTLSGIEVLESTETPGLGGEITNSEFKKQFAGLKTAPEIVCLKAKPTKANEIQAITAATISSKSVASIINKKIAKVKELVKK